MIFAGLAVAAHAESWVTISSMPGRALLQLDTDSVVKTSDSTSQATWRYGKSFEKSYVKKHGTIDCRNESMRLDTKTQWAFQDPVFPNGILINYAAASDSPNSRARPLSELERAEAFEFPDGGGNAQLFHRVCELEDLSEARLEESAAAIQKLFGCGSDAMVGSSLCARDAVTAETLHFLVLRLQQIEQACAITAVQMNMLLKSWLADDAACRRDGQRCDLWQMQLKVSGLGSDLARVALKQSCSFAPQAVQEAVVNDERRLSTARFRRCIARLIPELDDRVSSADVVASGALGSCRRELTPDLARSKTFSDAVLPGLTAAVLESRRQVRAIRGCLNFCVRGAERLVHGGGRRLRRTTDAVGKSVSS